MAWEKKNKTLSEYWDMLARHNWYYDYSDVQSTWRQGVESENTLRLHMNDTPEHKKLYDAFHAHHAGVLRGEKTAPPPRPEI